MPPQQVARADVASEGSQFGKQPRRKPDGMSATGRRRCIRSRSAAASSSTGTTIASSAAAAPAIARIVRAATQGMSAGMHEHAIVRTGVGGNGTSAGRQAQAHALGCARAGGIEFDDPRAGPAQRGNQSLPGPTGRRRRRDRSLRRGCGRRAPPPARRRSRLRASTVVRSGRSAVPAPRRAGCRRRSSRPKGWMRYWSRSACHPRTRE